MSKIFLFSVGAFLFISSCSKKDEIKPIREDIEEFVFASGQLEWDDLYNVTAQTEGVLENVDFEVGQFLEKGFLVAQISNENNVVNYKIANEQLEIANYNVNENAPAMLQLKENINFAESKYQQEKMQLVRFEKLYATNSIAKVELEAAQLNEKNAYTSLKSLQKQYELLKIQAKQQQLISKGQALNSKVNENYNFIIISQKGTVIKKFKNAGDYIKKGEVIATLANAQKVEIVLNVDENSISKIKLGQEVFVKLNTNRDKVYKGEISEILSAFDIQTQSFICKVVLNNTIPENLFGTQLEANILVGKKKNALLIPRDYLGYGNKVNVKGKDEIQVKTGIISTEYVEIKDGISSTDILLPLKLK